MSAQFDDKGTHVAQLEDLGNLGNTAVGPFETNHDNPNTNGL